MGRNRKEDGIELSWHDYAKVAVAMVSLNIIVSVSAVYISNMRK